MSSLPEIKIDLGDGASFQVIKYPNNTFECIVMDITGIETTVDLSLEQGKKIGKFLLK